MEDVVDGGEDRDGDAMAGTQDLGGAGGGNAFGGLMQLGKNLFPAFMSRKAKADAVVSGEFGGGGGHEVADAAEAQEG